MSKSSMLLRALVASPGDTAHERQTVREAIEHVNRDHSNQSGYHLVPFMWETDVHPGVGSDAQDVVNSQLPSYQIFVGIISARLGTPTSRGNSGTEEEFCNAFEKHIRDPSAVRILLYFRNASISVHDTSALIQAIHVCNFRALVSSMGVLYKEYQSPVDLMNTLRTDLAKCATELARGKSRLKRSTAPERPTVPSATHLHGNWNATGTGRFPQGASYRDLVLDPTRTARGTKYTTLRGHFISSSPYFRFGFKLLPVIGKPFGEGSIQTNGTNLVVHISKNFDSDILFLCSYSNGIRTRPTRRELLSYTPGSAVQLELRMSVDGSVVLSVANTFADEWYVDPSILNRVLLVAWADSNDFEATFQNIAVEYSS